MHITLIVLSFLTSTLAAPAQIAVNSMLKNKLITVSMKEDTSDRVATLERRQEQCLVSYCQPLYDSCVKSCDSLNNGDWYVMQAPSEPSRITD